MQRGFVELPQVWNYYCHRTQHRSNTEPCTCEHCCQRRAEQDPFKKKLQALAREKQIKAFACFPEICKDIEDELERQLKTHDIYFFTSEIRLVDPARNLSPISVGGREFLCEPWDTLRDQLNNETRSNRLIIMSGVLRAFEIEWNKRHPTMKLNKSNDGCYMVNWK